ncbi:uncharacterized protein BX664DRAFT_338393 [Halteromyces radiatus]|uniref:uncharacterized protein n=1 Tax=Halteromyces radiatus TaxID=101107 RepID=UPI0022204437|nr:uncharacterized protein BX664DRAFT_338393 [Halteromyces radiatus]KAI8085040.1 hypothetical protein BX664DRAFT_338393 [Halteromyces radiatus]
MFQQFKNIFPGSASLNIRSLADSVGLNEEEWRTRGMERLESIRSELQNFNALLINKSDSNSSEDISGKTITSNNITLEETAKVIARIQQGRETIHYNNIDNINKSKKADQLLQVLLSRCELHNTICTGMSELPEKLETTRQEMKSVTSAAMELKTKLLALEHRIDHACLEFEQHNFEKWKQEQEACLQTELEMKRQRLKSREAELNQLYEEHNEQQAKKRLELYDINFQSELEDYRRRRETEVSSLYNKSNTTRDKIMTTTLENLNLDNDNSEDLNQFLTDDDDDTNDKLDTTTARKTSLHIQANRTTNISDEDDDEEIHVEILADEDYESD